MSYRLVVSGVVMLAILGAVAWAAEGEAMTSSRGHQGPVWWAGLTPSKLGWGADSKAYPTRIAVNPKDGAELLWVPAGSFGMGSTEGPPNERPVHRVSLSGFWLYQHEVTNGQFGQFAAATGFADSDWQKYAEGREPHPVVRVSWEGARAYAEWAGVALPTEAQWEYAARGPKGSKYPWGDQWSDRKLCWWWNRGQNEDVGTFPVGSFPDGASWCGALDLAGNVYEWCADWFSPTYYAQSPAHDPPGPEQGETRVSRGGSWDSVLAIGCRGAFRVAVEEKHRCYCRGLRCAGK